VADGEVLRVGEMAITAHWTPGHTPGSTTWTWGSCEGKRCLNVVYADSLNAVSTLEYRFTGSDSHAGIIDHFRRSIAKVAELPCDILLAVHPGFADLDGKLKARAGEPRVDPFVDANACRVYAADAGKRLDARVAAEAADKPR
jgi:metallo-beta-lactamase class B